MLAGGGLSLPKLFVPSVKVGGDTALHDHCSHQTRNTVMVQSLPVSSVVKIMMPLIMLPLSVHPWSPCRVSHQILHTAQHDTMVLLLILLYKHTNCQYYQLSLSAGLPKHFKAEGSHRPGYWLLSPVSAACPVSGCRVTCSRDTRHQHRQDGFYRGGGSDRQHDAAWGHDTTRCCV